MPTLIVWGGHDAVVPVAHGHDAQEAMLGSRSEIFEDARHLHSYDDPSRFIAIVDDFIATTDSSRFCTERWAELLRSHAGRTET